MKIEFSFFMDNLYFYYMIERLLTRQILRDLSWSPIVGLVGSRQVGKTTLVRHLQTLITKPSLYLDLELQEDFFKLEDAQSYLDRYDHPLWKRYEQQATGAGHGGMDFFLFQAFVEGAKRSETPPFDVYDAATWLAVTPLSEDSIAMGSQPVAIPDFTRGRWTMRKATFGFSADY